MADFLSSGTDDIDFDKAASAFPDISLDGEGDFPSLPTQAPAAAVRGSSGFSFDDFGSPPREKETVVKVTGDDEIEKFESEFPDIDVGPASPPPQQQLQQQHSFSSATLAPRPQPSAFTPILNEPLQEDEPEVIREWREKQAAEIKARDEASKERREQTIQNAMKSIDEFYEDYSAKKERSIRDNKDEEREYLQTLNASLTTGTTWDRIADMIELKNSQSKTIARTGAGTTDLTRFKEVLLRLKREGDAAPGAGGY